MRNFFSQWKERENKYYVIIIIRNSENPQITGRDTKDISV